MAAQQLRRMPNLIFCTFNGTAQGLITSCDEEEQPITGPCEGWHKFGAVLDCKASRRSSPSIDKAAFGEPRFHGQRGLLDGWQRGADRRDRGELTSDHCLKDI